MEFYQNTSHGLASQRIHRACAEHPGPLPLRHGQAQ